MLINLRFNSLFILHKFMFLNVSFHINIINLSFNQIISGSYKEKKMYNIKQNLKHEIKQEK